MRLITFLSLLTFCQSASAINFASPFFPWSFHLQCNFTEDSWNFVGAVTTCHASGRRITKIAWANIVYVNGDTKNFFDQVHGMTVENQHWEELPVSIQRFFPNLKALKVSESKLKMLNRISSLTELVVLSLNENALQYLDGDVFSENSKLRSLTLTDNNLLVINGPVLDVPKFLQFVDIGIPCLIHKCEYSDCIPESRAKFKEKCEFDVIYPGFKEYYERRLYCERAAFMYENNLPETVKMQKH